MTMAEIQAFKQMLESEDYKIKFTEPSLNMNLPEMPDTIPIIETPKQMNEKTPETALTESGIDPTDINAVKKHGFPLTRKQRRAIERKLNKKIKRK